MMDSSTSSTSVMMETLVENAKYMPSQQQKGDAQPSACELKCQTQQAALVSCMKSIRQSQSQSQPSLEGSVDTNAKACLAPSIAAWTDCCAKANNHEI